MRALEDRRFLFITGKGGVGKTTVTAAIAQALAARGKRVLISQCGAKERISKLFDAAPLTSAIEPIAPGVWAVMLVSEVALREYGMLVLKSRRLVNTVFDNRYVMGFLTGTPGLKEWSLLGKAWYHSTELDAAGRPRFDVVLFDAPATGHGLDMLRVPKVIVDMAPPGILQADADRAWKMFQDPDQSGVVVVSLPEEMATNETLELCAALQGELRLPIAELIVNTLSPSLFDARERAELSAWELSGPEQPGDSVIASGRARAVRERIQDECLARLRELGVPLRTLPRLLDGAATPGAIATLAASF